MVLEVRALLRDLANLCQRKDLKPPAVGQNWAVPVHKSMEPAKMAHDLESWPNEKVIGIAEDDLRIELSQFAWSDRLHCPLCTDRHEGRRLDPSVPRREPPASRSCYRIGSEKLEHRPILMATWSMASASANLKHIDPKRRNQ